MIIKLISFKIKEYEYIVTYSGGGKMVVNRAFASDRVMKSLTGMTIQEFNGLLPAFEKALEEFEADKNKEKVRLRAEGGGRKHSLKIAQQKLFFILFYMKVYPTFDVAGFVFGVHRSQPHLWYKPLMAVLEKALKIKLVLPKRKIRSVEEFFQAFPEAKDLFIDGTERKTQRPKKPKKQKNQYSGKKKAHTRKNTIMCNEKKRIMVVSPTKDGHLHDKKQLEKEETINHIPKKVNIWVDTGFLGIEKLVNGNKIFMPKKKPKGGQLTAEEKSENKIISSIRIVVEHAIGGMKRFRCLTDLYRNKNGIDDKFTVICKDLVS